MKGILIVLLVLVVLCAIYAISTNNKFVSLQNKIEEAFSTMDVYLVKRAELIPNLVATVKGYAKHEGETLERLSLPETLPRQQVKRWLLNQKSLLQ